MVKCSAFYEALSQVWVAQEEAAICYQISFSVLYCCVPKGAGETPSCNKSPLCMTGKNQSGDVKSTHVCATSQTTEPPSSRTDSLQQCAAYRPCRSEGGK